MKNAPSASTTITAAKDFIPYCTSINQVVNTMSHVLRCLRNGIRTARDAVQNLVLPTSSVSEEDEEPISSTPLVVEEEGGGYGSPDDSQRLGFTDRYVDWTHSKDSIFRANLAFVIYLIVAIVVYSFILEEWSVLDSVYFAVTVFTTVGTLQFVLLGEPCIIHRLRFLC
jgi:hypothetical protein